MGLVDSLAARWADNEAPFLIHPSGSLAFADLIAAPADGLEAIKPGEVVALVGDFDPRSIAALLRLFDRGAVVVPLTKETRASHDYFFQAAHVDAVIEDGKITRLKTPEPHPLIEQLRAEGHAGLVLFSTGTTGLPKAILHDMALFLRRFETPRPTLRTLSFLLFDHIGGLNTLLHTLFNRGVVVAPPARTVEAILSACAEHRVELLPTSPTFLRMMLMSGALPGRVPASLKVITYGTERMDQPTLDALCAALPDIDFRQTYGMSELGILRVKSEARDSLYMSIGGEGVETRVEGGCLQIRSASRMLGYLNAPSPFDADGWYDTGDIVEERSGLYRITGRRGDVINVGGLKFMAADVERAAIDFPGVSFARARARDNPITGQHVELDVQPRTPESFDLNAFRMHMRERLAPHMQPKRIRVADIPVGHRFKRT
ncbi:putative sulfoacetate-CoA ligase [Hartmannibacter diazotrophicus]|uniref:Putative sulfoacetate-CoA ligase n=1 Tax=Hartmannibacter diazotrophicus TaxID=1482074 RepID=A0A2C9D8T8_9HYPH|nr:fatty acid--CoA ligase family protein [Hartmannibacter diazotrophicus]SON56151.1 putative sulfoacetate-CoA ligase [Hartmannibacter diazotrophicus]